VNDQYTTALAVMQWYTTQCA